MSASAASAVAERRRARATTARRTLGCGVATCASERLRRPPRSGDRRARRRPRRARPRTRSRRRARRRAPAIDGGSSRLAEARRREPAAARGRRLGELGAQHVARAPRADLAEDRMLGIDDDEARPRGHAEREGVRRLIDVPRPRAACVPSSKARSNARSKAKSGVVARTCPAAPAAAVVRLRLLHRDGAAPRLRARSSRRARGGRRGRPTARRSARGCGRSPPRGRA